MLRTSAKSNLDNTANQCLFLQVCPPLDDPSNQYLCLSLSLFVFPFISSFYFFRFSPCSIILSTTIAGSLSRNPDRSVEKTSSCQTQSCSFGHCQPMDKSCFA